LIIYSSEQSLKEDLPETGNPEEVDSDYGSVKELGNWWFLLRAASRESGINVELSKRLVNRISFVGIDFKANIHLAGLHSRDPRWKLRIGWHHGLPYFQRKVGKRNIHLKYEHTARWFIGFLMGT